VKRLGLGGSESQLGEHFGRCLKRCPHHVAAAGSLFARVRIDFGQIPEVIGVR